MMYIFRAELQYRVVKTAALSGKLRNTPHIFLFSDDSEKRFGGKAASGILPSSATSPGGSVQILPVRTGSTSEHHNSDIDENTRVKTIANDDDDNNKTMDREKSVAGVVFG